MSAKNHQMLRARGQPSAYQVSSDLSERRGVTVAELDVLEVHLANVLDDLLDNVSGQTEALVAEAAGEEHATRRGRAQSRRA